MANLTNTLYPPQPSGTFMPAFVADSADGATIYYSISPYNNVSSIKRIHVSLTDQTTNSNALKSPNAIYIRDEAPRYDETVGMYVIHIPPSVVLGDEFKHNQFYKVQLRFDCSTASAPTRENEIAAYVRDNQTSFSEWSSVCLIKPISTPVLIVSYFDSEDNKGIAPGFNRGIIPISARVAFKASRDSSGYDNTETETLQSYVIRVLSLDGNEVLYETNDIYTGSSVEPNSIDYKLDIQALDVSAGDHLIIEFMLTTSNQYVFNERREFQIVDFVENDRFAPVLSVDVNDEDAVATLHIVNNVPVQGTIYIKRASSVDDFKTWESFYAQHVNGTVDLSLEDSTVGSMVWYIYSVQLENSKGGMTRTFRTSKFMPQFYDAILSRMDIQFAIRYDYKISNMKPVVNRAKVDTLGSKYPKFTQNGVLDYKQLSISGMISAQSDSSQRFMNKRSHFGQNYPDYVAYRDKNGITDWYDYLWEREFRESAMSWLNDGNPKLLRTMTEGILVVMLTDVSLTPNEVLGRRLWTFTATAYEIADGYHLDNLQGYGLFDSNYNKLTGNAADNEPGEYVIRDRIGQQHEYTVPSSLDNLHDYDIVTDMISRRLEERYVGVLSDYKISDIHLRDIKICFNSRPDVFSVQRGTDGSITGLSLHRATGGNDISSDTMVGYKFLVKTSVSNGAYETIFVNSDGYYQIPNGVDVIGLKFMTPGDNVTVDYTVTYREAFVPEEEYSSMVMLKSTVGQLTKNFKYGVFAGSTIKSRYGFLDYDVDSTGRFVLKSVRKMKSWRGICVDADPYSVVSVQYDTSEAPVDYIVGQGGTLNIIDGFKSVDMCFKGRRMFERPWSDRMYLLQNEYAVKSGITYSAIEEIKPVNRCVYHVGKGYMLYDTGKWMKFKLDSPGEYGTVMSDVYGSITYYGDIYQSNL